MSRRKRVVFHDSDDSSTSNGSSSRDSASSYDDDDDSYNTSDEVTSDSSNVRNRRRKKSSRKLSEQQNDRRRSQDNAPNGDATIRKSVSKVSLADGGHGETLRLLSQQQLPGRQLLLTPTNITWMFACIGIVCLPISVELLLSSRDAHELFKRYDDVCGTVNVTHPDTCTFDINVTHNMNPNIYLYYELTNFYQNQRLYVKSRSDDIMQGDLSVSSAGSCSPLIRGFGGAVLVPCGLIAASIFNDSISVQRCRMAAGVESCVTLSGADFTKDGIAWPTDRDHLYKLVNNGSLPAGFTRVTADNVTLPLTDDEELMVWMRISALPTVRKLHRRIVTMSFKTGDRLRVTIVNNYPTHAFGGEKRLIFSTTTWVGGKNDFLGYATLLLGTVSMLLAIMFGLKQSISPRKMGDMSFFLWSDIVAKHTKDEENGEQQNNKKE